jgi:hypothetical protein
MIKSMKLTFAGMALTALSATAAAGVQVDVNIGVPAIANPAPTVVYREVPVYRTVPVYVERRPYRHYRHYHRHYPHRFTHRPHWHDYR